MFEFLHVSRPIQAGAQIACEICGARRMRGRIQVCATGEQLHVSGRQYVGDVNPAHITWTVSIVGVQWRVLPSS